ncbi:MAG: glutamine-hydrolyzing GMP synthase [Oscillospiraceae bacterium]|nr:glutamine-hydrolyzing GMP synthase [Oscillospiraceae bacterium]
MKDFIKQQIAEIQAQVGKRGVLLGLSGGVDSSVCAALIEQALPGQLHCIFVDHGLMRKNEGDEIAAVFSKKNLNFIRVNAQERFLSRLAGVTDPEAKRKIIGEEFIRVFEEEAAKLGSVDFLAQGTIYPDVAESGSDGHKKVKSHHNVALPDDIGFAGLVEPLRSLYKEDVRAVGRELGLPEALVARQPFPGPGIGVRILGEITREKCDLLREADAIVREEIDKLPTESRPSQYFAILPDLLTVGVRNSERCYEHIIAVRAVSTRDFVTGQYTRLSHKVLEVIAARITAEVAGVNRVVYDITDKPPGTVEWE